MSGQLRVAFASDMPAATVEVVSPDMEVVDRFMLDGGRSRTQASGCCGRFRGALCW